MSKERFIRLALALAILLAGLAVSQAPVSAQLPRGVVTGGCWGIVPTPSINAESSNIRGISASSPSDVWAVGSLSNLVPGSGRSPLIMHYGGTGWEIMATDVITQRFFLEDVAALAPNNVWAVGSYYGNTPGIGTPYNKLIIHWDGKAWSVSLKGGPGEVNGVWATAPDDVWAVGEMGRDRYAGIATVYHWDGRAWSETPIRTNYLNDVVALSREDVWVTGSDTFHWDGNQWTRSAAHDSREMQGLVALGANDVWTVGVATQGVSIQHWNGLAWTEFPSIAERDTRLQAIGGLATDDVWAVGGRYPGSGAALLLHWDGSQWSAIPNPVPGFSSSLYDIKRVGDELWAGGSRRLKTSGEEAVIARYTKTPCPEPGPLQPLNPPVPLPGTGSLPFVTGKSINGIFLKYWQEHGGLQQQGYPITSELGEVSELDGKIYTVQYFERAVFEYHPEHRGTPYEVLLSHLGAFQYKQKYPNGAPNQRPNRDEGTLFFPETGKRLGGSFLKYWREHGGLIQQGYPISDEFTEINDLDGRPYTVQYFERSVFEWHPENAPPYNVLLSQLGRFRYDKKYAGEPQAPPTSEPRRVAATVREGRLRGRDRYLLWNEASNLGASLRAYDAEQNRHFLLSEGEKYPADADGKRAAWAIGPNQVQLYDLGTGGTFSLTVPARVPQPPDFARVHELAVDDTALYYISSNSTGYTVAAQDTIRREDRTIATTASLVEGLWASNGIVMWVERTLDEQSLHVWSAQARSEFVPASGLGAFTGYGAEGDYLMWSFYNSTISDQTTYLFNMRTGTRKVLNTGAASGPVISGNRIAWTRWPDRARGETGGWNVEAYDIATGSTGTAVAGFAAMPHDLVLLQSDMLAFTADADVGTPGYDLFVVDLAR
ncbi:MAG: hypothetical protein WCD37_01895 [Chloroflexia bacterium]